MRNRRLRQTVLLFLMTLSSLTQAQTRARFEFQTTTLPSGVAGRPYTAKVITRNGTGPFLWHVQGKLPPGITLQPNIGVLNGTPTIPGTYKFKLTVTDQAKLTSISREFVIEIVGLLTVQWKQQPMLTENTISGSVTVSNLSRDTYDLTGIIVAVNEIGKAFALGYQHFNLGPSAKQDIPFESALPNGQYIVHADAVAEILSRNLIRRARMETPQRIVVNVNR